MSSSVSLGLVLRCCWEGIPLALWVVVEGRYSGMVVVADNDRPELATSCHHQSSADLSHGPDLPAVVGCTYSSPRFLLVLSQISHVFAVRQAVWPGPP